MPRRHGARSRRATSSRRSGAMSAWHEAEESSGALLGSRAGLPHGTGFHSWLPSFGRSDVSVAWGLRSALERRRDVIAPGLHSETKALEILPSLLGQGLDLLGS